METLTQVYTDVTPSPPPPPPPCKMIEWSVLTLFTWGQGWSVILGRHIHNLSLSSTALMYYRHAVQLVPDIEYQVHSVDRPSHMREKGKTDIHTFRHFHTLSHFHTRSDSSKKVHKKNYGCIYISSGISTLIL